LAVSTSALTIVVVDGGSAGLMVQAVNFRTSTAWHTGSRLLTSPSGSFNHDEPPSAEIASD